VCLVVTVLCVGEHQYEILDYVAAKFHEELGVFKLLVITTSLLSLYYCYRLRPVLTATHHSYGSRVTFWLFSLSALGVRPPNGPSRKMAQTTCFHTRMCLCS